MHRISGRIILAFWISTYYRYSALKKITSIYDFLDIWRSFLFFNGVFKVEMKNHFIKSPVVGVILTHVYSR
jgi:hypothetical protein